MAHNISTNQANKENVDMICFNRQCIANKQQLFKYSSSRDLHSQHLVQECYILHLHPLNRLEQLQKQILEQVQETLLASNLKVLQNLIYSFKTRIFNMHSNISAQVIQEWAENAQNILNQKMIERLKRYKDVDENIQWLNELYSQNKQSLKKTCFQLMKPTIAKLTNELNKLNTNLDQKIQRICNTVEQQYRNNKGSQIQSAINKKNNKSIHDDSNINEQQVEENQPENLNVLNSFHKFDSLQNSQQMPSFPSEQKQKKEMIKVARKIYKDNAKSKHITIGRDKNGRFMKGILKNRIKSKNKLYQPTKQQFIPLQHSVCHNEVIELSQSSELMIIQKYNQLILKNTQDINKLLSLGKGYQIDKLVFFCSIDDSSFATIINTFKPIKIIFNCSALLSKNIFHQIRMEVLSNLQIFEQHWDHNQFFMEIAQSKHFPKINNNYKKHKKNHFIERFWKKMTSLKNVWISNLSQLKAIQDPHQLLYIYSLRIQPCKCNAKTCITFYKLLTFTLKYFQNITSLKTLIIKNCTFDFNSILLLTNLLKNNKNLQCVFLENNLNISCDYLNFLNGLNLKKLAVINEIHFIQPINCTPIFKMKSLQYLYLNSITFSKDTFDTNIGYDLEKACITNLKNLSFLDLYNLNSSPKFISYLHPQTYEKLTYLNLGYTDVDSQTIIPFLASFKSLQYLSLDATTINLTNFFTYKNNEQNLSKTLRYLSLRWFVGNQQQKKFKNSNYHPLTEQNFVLLASAFPNLEYLNISDSLDVISAGKIMILDNLTDICVDKRYIKKQFLQQMNQRQIKVYKWESTVSIEQL